MHNTCRLILMISYLATNLNNKSNPAWVVLPKPGSYFAYANVMLC